MTAAAEHLKKEAARAKRESLERTLHQQLIALKLTGGMVMQYRPFSDIAYAFDFAWPYRDPVVFVEVQGGIWSGGAHVRPKGVQRDMDKVNRAALIGAYVLQVSAEDIKSGKAISLVEKMLKT